MKRISTWWTQKGEPLFRVVILFWMGGLVVVNAHDREVWWLLLDLVIAALMGRWLYRRATAPSVVWVNVGGKRTYVRHFPGGASEIWDPFYERWNPLPAEYEERSR